MAKIKKPAAEGKEDAWLDELTEDQAKRDEEAREAEKADRPAYQPEIPEKAPVHVRGYNPIPAKELSDIIVDVIFKEIQEKGYTPNWPRIMSSIGYAQRQLRRRWGELTGARTKFGGRFSDRQAYNRSSGEEATEQRASVETPSPEPRGGEATESQTTGPAPGVMEI